MNPKTTKLIAFVLFWVITIGIALYALNDDQNPIDDLPDLFEATDFTMTNQNNETFTLSETDGQVRVLTFIYTKCTMGCSTVNSKLAELRDDLQEGDMFDNVQLITIDFDTIYDTHADLVEYSELFVEDGDRWQFLTSDTQTINETAEAYNFDFWDNTTMDMDMNDTMDDMNMTTSLFDPGYYELPNYTSQSSLHLNQHEGHEVVWIHPFMVYFIDPDGMVRNIQGGLDWSVDHAADVVDFLLNE
jgi:protein SCO1/2